MLSKPVTEDKKSASGRTMRLSLQEALAIKSHEEVSL